MGEVTAVILCGGSGTRLWPLSRKAAPKQFQPLIRGQSPFALTLERARAFAPDRLVCVTASEYRFDAAQALRGFPLPVEILLEPVARNTGPALCAAALAAREKGDPVLVCLPADHHLPDIGMFATLVARAVEVAKTDRWCLVGINPAGPSSQYGYIVPADAGELSEIAFFREKPDRDAAQALLARGAMWNGGIFVVRASVMLASFAAHAPDILAAVMAAHQGRTGKDDFTWLGAEAYARSPAISIDHAVIERQANMSVCRFSGSWSDIGNFESLAALSPADGNGNVIEGDAQLINSSASIVVSPHRLTLGLGLAEMVVVDTPDALLVAHKSELGNLRAVVEGLSAASRPEAIMPRRVFRPWGSYETLDSSPVHQVKHLRVAPGASLSLQYHRQRAEHWVVIAGTARVTCGDRTFDLNANESTFIPQGVVHRLANAGPDELEVIEVQTGDYFGEDDIIRIEDDYSRVTS